MKAKLFNIILNVDQLGESVSLRINKEKTAKTFIGGLFTIVLVVSLITIFVFVSLDTINHANPSAIIETQILDKRPNITLTKNNLPIAIGLTDAGTGIIEEGTYYKYKAILIYNKNQANYDPIVIELKLKKCEAEDFPQLSKEVIFGISLDQMRCIENQNFTLKGYWNELDIQYLKVSVEMCNGTTESGKKCSDRETIMERIRTKEMYFNIFMVDTSISLQNYKYPLSQYVLTKYEALTTETFKTSELFIKEQQLHTDDQILFYNDIRNNSMAFDYEASSDVTIGDSGILSEFQILTSNKYEIHHRKYKKISESLAEVGGLSSVFYFLLKTACYLFTTIKQEEQILERIFEFDLNYPKNQLVRTRTSYIFNQKMFAEFQKQNNEINKSKNSNLSKSKNENENESEKSNSSISNISHIQLEETDIKNKNKINNSYSKKRKSLFRIFDGNVAIKKSGLNFPIGTLKNSELVKMEPNSENNELNVDENFNHVPVIINENMKDIIGNENEYGLNRMNTGTKNYQKQETIINQEESKEDNKLKRNKTDIKSKEVIKTILSEKEKNNKLTFSFAEIVRYYICPCKRGEELTRKFLLLKKSKNVLKEFLDIRFIVEKLNEFEKFKSIMLSDEQIDLFKLISKDICSLDDKNSKLNKLFKIKELNDPDKNSKVMAKFLKDLSAKKREHEISEIDKKLFSLIYDQVEKDLVAEKIKSLR